jgi:hypothetical protein
MKKQASLIKVLLIGLAAMLLMLAAFYAYKSFSLRSDAKDMLDKGIAQTMMFANITYEGISANAFSEFITIKNIKVEPNIPVVNPISIEKVRYQTVKDKLNPELYTDIVLQVTGLKTQISTIALDPQAAAIINQFPALENLHTHFSLEFHYQPELRKLLTKVEQELVGLGEIGVGIIMGNLSPHAVDPMSGMDAEIHHVLLRYDDQSFISQLIEIFAKQNQMTRAEVIGLIEAQFAELLTEEQDPKIVQLAQQLLIFIKQPKSIVIEANPELPVTVGSLQTMPLEMAIERLDVKVAVNQ